MKSDESQEDDTPDLSFFIRSVPKHDDHTDVNPPNGIADEAANLNSEEPTDPLQVERANQQWQGLLEPFRACLWQNQLNAHLSVYEATAHQSVAPPVAAPQVVQSPIIPPNDFPGTFTGHFKSNGAPIFRGPRGGIFCVTASGNRSYLKSMQFPIDNLLSSLETTRQVPYIDALQVERANQQWLGLLEPLRAFLWQNQLNAHRVVFQAVPAAAPEVTQPPILPPNGFPGTFTGHFRRNGSPIFRGPRGGIFYVTAGGNRCSITLGQFATIEAMSQRMVYV